MKRCAILQPNHQEFGKKKKQRDAATRIDAEIRAVFREFEYRFEQRAAFERLLACVRAHTGLLRPIQGQGWAGPVFLINRLRNLAARQADWIRPCEQWRPTQENLRPVFRSLAMHLLALYPTPGFLDSVWDVPAGPEGFRQQGWYIRLSRGASLRQINIPLVLTRKMEHYIRQAPDHYSVWQAFRYGETRGLGGSEGLAREIANSSLGRGIQHPEFWRSVLHFFVNHPELELQQVNPIIDFIQHHKFPTCEVLTEQGPVYRPGLWPGFSIEGRTPKSMLRFTLAWHSHLVRNKQGRNFSWAKSGIEGYRFEDNRDDEQHPHTWIIEELLQSNELYAEGRALHHCVYSYAHRCRNLETTIWSLRLRIQDRQKNMATIEVDAKSRCITQVRAKCDLPPGRRSLEIIRQWAAWAGLEFNLRV